MSLAIDVVRNPPLDTGLADRLVEVWMAVTEAGGAVGFLPGVTAAQVWTVAGPAFARVTDGTDDLAVAFDGGRAVGFGFLETNSLGLHRHWATVKRLQRDPAARRRGVGGAVLAELEAAGRDRGLHRIVLTVRGGTGREGFYIAQGYRIEARLPGRLWIAEDDIREELVMAKVLDGASGLNLQVQRLDPELPLPTYAHAGDAGLDLVAREAVTLAPGERTVVPTGVAIALPPGCVGLVHPRSGLAARHGIGLVNAPGTIDEGYRGEVKVVLINHDPTKSVTIDRGDRIAQLVVQRVEQVHVVETDALGETGRGAGGFGSSGR